MSALSSAHRFAGVLCLLAGASAVVGGIGPLLTVQSASALGQLFGDGPAAAPDVPAAHWACLAGLMLVVAGAGLLAPRLAASVRPAAAALWVAPLPAAFSALRTASAAVDASANPDPFVKLAAPTLGFGWGAWLLIASAVCACATGLACLAAGVSDREAWESAQDLAESQKAAQAKRGRKGGKARRHVEVEADPSDRPLPRREAVVYAAAGGFGALGPLLPLYRGPGFHSPWLPDVPFSSDAFGQFLLAATAATAAAVAARSRRSKRPALFVGAALSLVAYAAGYLFLPCREPEAVPGPGAWLSLVGAVAFVAAALAAPGPVSGPSGGWLGSLRRDRTKIRR